MWNFLEGCVYHFWFVEFVYVCVCACVRTWKRKRGSTSARLPAKQLQMSRDVLCVCIPTEGLELPLCLTWVICLLHTRNFLFSLSLHECRLTHKHTVADPYTGLQTLLSVNSTHSLQEAEVGQHFTPSGQHTRVHRSAEDRNCFHETSHAGHFQDRRRMKGEERLRQKKKKKISNSKSPLHFSTHWCIGLNTHSYWTTLASL